MKEISNIKISCVFKLPSNWRELLKSIAIKRNIKIKTNANFQILHDKYVICIFEKKDKTVHFNVTKIKSINDVFNFLFFFSCEYFTYDTTLLSLKIDNITSSFNINQIINLKRVQSFFQDSKFNPERFAGLFIKYFSGTAIIFRNGKVNIVGCKKVITIKEIWQQLKPILLNCVCM
jgi:Transcription factor TFIID (or TATA-binding protein, TBP)